MRQPTSASPVSHPTAGSPGSARFTTITSIALSMMEKEWSFATMKAAEIAAHWSAAVARRPELWNGEVLIGRGYRMSGSRLEAHLSHTSYASFIAWRSDAADSSACHIFGMPGVVTSDGALVFGVMAEHTYNAGRIYPPGGSLDPSDIRADGSVDILGSIARELQEETGLDPASARPLGIHAIELERTVIVLQYLGFPMPADEIVSMVAAKVTSERNSELCGIHLIRDHGDFRREMPPFAQAIAGHFLGNRPALTAHCW